MEIWAHKEVLDDEFIDRLTDNVLRMDTPPPTDDEDDDDYIPHNAMDISMMNELNPFGLHTDSFNMNAISFEFDEEEYVIEEPSLAFNENDDSISLVPNFYLDDQSFSSFEDEDDDRSLYISTLNISNVN